MFTMHHFATIYDNGTVHVQNCVAGMDGQHHVHTLKGYRKWKKDVGGRNAIDTKAKPGAMCDCGLAPGQMREYDGKVWENTDHPEWK